MTNLLFHILLIVGVLESAGDDDNFRTYAWARICVCVCVRARVVNAHFSYSGFPGFNSRT